MDNIKSIFQDSIDLKKTCIQQGLQCIGEIGYEVVQSVKNGNKLMLCGNGGSAADAQHLAAEMLIRLRSENNREGIPAIALAQDTSTITACSNDFSYDTLYLRMIKSLGKEGDCLIGISTTGDSSNVVLAMQEARRMGVKVFGFLGANGGKALQYCDKAFIVPSKNTGRIQEVHITAGHALMEYVEDKLLEEKYIHLENKAI